MLPLREAAGCAAHGAELDDAEDARVHGQVHAKTKIGPVIVSGAVWEQQFGALKEHALGNARVLNARLDNVDRVIIQVEVDNALSDAVVLIWVLDDGLKEVSFKFEYLQQSDLNEQMQIDRKRETAFELERQLAI